MKKSVLLAGTTLLFALPLGLLLPGCGGGNGGGIFNTQTYASTLALSANQTAQLTLRATGSQAKGTLVVPAATSQSARATQALSSSIPPGTYILTGSITGFNFVVSGNFGNALGTFSIEGQLPTQGGNGVFTLTNNNQSASGTFGNTSPTTSATTSPTTSATTSPTTSATTAPTTSATTAPTTTPTGNDGTTNLSVVSAGGATFGTSTFNTSNVKVTGKQQNGSGFSINATDAGGRTLLFETRSFGWPNQFRLLQDQTFEFSGFNDSFRLQSGTKVWVAGFISGSSGGTLKVASINGETVTLQAQNLNLGTSSFGLPTGATGSLTVNGTIVVKIPVS